MSEPEIPGIGETVTEGRPATPDEEAEGGAVRPPAEEGEARPRRKALREKEEAEAAGEKPKRERGAKEPKPQVPLPALAWWHQGRFETVGEAQIVKGPYELLVRPGEPKEGNARRPITDRLEIEGQFRLPPELVNTKTFLRIGDLLLHVYVLSTSHTGGTHGDIASFIIVRELQDEDQVRALAPPA
jgi:hypothetical protein